MRDRYIGVLAEVLHDLDLVRDFLLPVSCRCVSGLWKPNDDIRLSIAEAETEAHVEGSVEKSNKFSGPFSFPAPSDKMCQFGLSAINSTEPVPPFVITVFFF